MTSDPAGTCAGSTAIAAFIRAHKREIAERWEPEILERAPQLARLERGARIDHLPEFLDALADWLEGGDEDTRRRLFATLADGHAVQRLTARIDIATLALEYGTLRKVLLEHLLRAGLWADFGAGLIRLNEGMDLAVHESAERYRARRDELRERFIGILGHDLRSPLSAVTSYGHALLYGRELDVKQTRAVEAILRSSARMGRMIEHVLEFARTHLGGGMPVTPSAGDLGLLCRTAVAEIVAQHPDRVITVETRGDVRGFWDHDRVIQALANVLTNAVQHVEGPIAAQVWEDPEQRAVFTVVTNGGPPMSTETLARVFDPFRREAAAGTPRRGLGLGLYIVQQVVLAHGGLCGVQSDERGTAVTIRWPRTPVEEMPDRE